MYLYLQVLNRYMSLSRGTLNAFPTCEVMMLNVLYSAHKVYIYKTGHEYFSGGNGTKSINDDRLSKTLQ